LRTRGETVGEDIKREAALHCGFNGVTWAVSPSIVPVIPYLLPDLAPEMLETGVKNGAEGSA
jgi:hypothetical protein